MEIVVAPNGMINFILSDAELWEELWKTRAYREKIAKNLIQ